MSPARRPASELPGNPGLLRLVYSHERPSVPWCGFEDTLEQWEVSIRAYHLEEDECDGGCTDTREELIRNGTIIGHLILWRLRMLTGADPWEAADAESGDLESIAAAVFEDGDYCEAFEEAIDGFGDLLILDRVYLSKPWRGFGLGPIFAAEAIHRLCGGCCAVAAEPGVAEYPENRELVTDEFRATARKKIAALWESIGFRPFRHGVQLLDTSLQRPLDLLHERRDELQDLCKAYENHQAQLRPVPAPVSQDPTSAPQLSG
ncbi:hypothetical protein ACFC1R_34810 [Kitasatospora sp. NPDC056138]|uniref:hypothetical protein n=1 Tax=Kitasatospora sp. NPDC056138 TaxID=3345724 RepID=UPI0035E0C0B6